jgi:pimeloyl-[acyl-carrier protein] methyl ester esterase
VSAPLVVLPGWGLGRGSWQAWLTTHGEGLGATLIVDLPGYGDTPCVADDQGDVAAGGTTTCAAGGLGSPSFATACELLAARLPKSCTLLGWSLGALFALALAARHPQRITRLVLVAGSACFVQRAGWPHALAAEELAAFRAIVAEHGAAALPRFVGNFNRGDAQARALTRQLMAEATPPPTTAILLQGLDWLRDADLRALPAQVRAPTLLIHGAADPLMPAAATHALAAQIADARLELIAGAAHAPFASAPKQCAAALADFLS